MSEIKLPIRIEEEQGRGIGWDIFIDANENQLTSEQIVEALNTANATILALEGKLAAAEAIIRRSRAAFVVLSDTLEPRKGGNLAREQIAAIDEWQMENTDDK